MNRRKWVLQWNQLWPLLMRYQQSGNYTFPRLTKRSLKFYYFFFASYLCEKEDAGLGDARLEHLDPNAIEVCPED